MKAVIYDNPGDPDVLHIGEWEKPVAGEHEILVKVVATALNRADILQRRGKYPPPKGASPILGLEISGTVAGCGEKVSKWSDGDRVFGLIPGGGYAEYAVIHEDMALPVPDNLSMEAAAAIPEVFLTAFQSIKWLSDLKKEETILIHAGASGVGTAAIQLARETGAKVIVTASAHKHEVCLELGAFKAIDYHEGPFEKPVMKITEGKGVDVIIDFIAAPYLNQNISCLNTDGRLVLLANLGGVTVDQFNMGPVLFKRLTIMGSTLRSRSRDYQIRLTKAFGDFCLDLFGRGRIKPVIDQIYDWTRVSEAHQRMENNENQGKIVLKIG